MAKLAVTEKCTGYVVTQLYHTNWTIHAVVTDAFPYDDPLRRRVCPGVPIYARFGMRHIYLALDFLDFFITRDGLSLNLLMTAMRNMNAYNGSLHPFMRVTTEATDTVHRSYINSVTRLGHEGAQHVGGGIFQFVYVTAGSINFLMHAANRRNVSPVYMPDSTIALLLRKLKSTKYASIGPMPAERLTIYTPLSRYEDPLRPTDRVQLSHMDRPLKTITTPVCDLYKASMQVIMHLDKTTQLPQPT